MTAVAPAISRPSRDRVLVIGAVSVMVCLWASAFVAIRFADRELSAGALALGRLLVGSAALGIFVLVRRAPMPGRRELAGIAVCGVLWFGLYNVALNAAEQRVDAGTAAMLVNVGPILIAILAGVLLHEGFPPRLLAGCLVSFAGVVVIGVATTRHGLHDILGAVLCLVAAVGYAGGVVAQKPVLRHASPLSVTWLACTIGAISCFPYAGSLVHGVGHAGALNDRLDDLPRLGPDRPRIRALGVRVGPHDRRAHGLDHVSRAAARAAVRRGRSSARSPRRSCSPGAPCASPASLWPALAAADPARDNGCKPARSTPFARAVGGKPEHSIRSYYG